MSGLTRLVAALCIALIAAVIISAVNRVGVVFESDTGTTLVANRTSAYIFVPTTTYGWSGNWLRFGLEVFGQIFQKAQAVHHRKRTLVVLEVKQGAVHEVALVDTRTSWVVLIDGRIVAAVNGTVMEWSGGRFVSADEELRRQFSKISQPGTVPDEWIYVENLFGRPGMRSYSLPDRRTEILAAVVPGRRLELYRQEVGSAPTRLWSLELGTRIVDEQAYQSIFGAP